MKGKKATDLFFKKMANLKLLKMQEGYLMGYESRLYIVNECTIKNKIKGEKDYINAEIIAIFNMCIMEKSFHDIFNAAIDYELIGDFDENLTVDKYGDRVKKSNLQNVIEWLKIKVQYDNYRRLQPLLHLLEGFNLEQWDNLVVLHYGY